MYHGACVDMRRWVHFHFTNHIYTFVSLYLVLFTGKNEKYPLDMYFFCTKPNKPTLLCVNTKFYCIEINDFDTVVLACCTQMNGRMNCGNLISFVESLIVFELTLNTQFVLIFFNTGLWVMMDYRAGNGNEDMKYLMQQHHPHHTPWDVNPWAQVRNMRKKL